MANTQRTALLAVAAFAVALTAGATRTSQASPTAVAPEPVQVQPVILAVDQPLILTEGDVLFPIELRVLAVLDVEPSMAFEPPKGAKANLEIVARPVPEAGSDDPLDYAALSDEEMNDVQAGDMQLQLDQFNVAISQNEAGFFTMDIAQNAFQNAQGVFTTIQAVNSAVNLNLDVIVNIFLNGQSS